MLLVINLQKIVLVINLMLNSFCAKEWILVGNGAAFFFERDSKKGAQDAPLTKESANLDR